MKNLLSLTEYNVITVDGKEMSTEEAASLFSEMTAIERVKYQGMSDLQIIISIYSDTSIGFNYIKG